MGKESLVSAALLVSLMVCAGCPSRGNAAGDAYENLAPAKGRGHDLSVENQGPVVIFASVKGQPFGRIDVGILDPGACATEAFGPFRIGGIITALWGEGEDHVERDRSVELDTKPFLAVADKMTIFRLTYLGNSKWQMSALDDERKELLVVKPRN